MTDESRSVHFDVVVIGAGLAGSVVASVTSNAGLATLLLEAGTTEAEQVAAPQRGFKARLNGAVAPGRWPYRLAQRHVSGREVDLSAAQGFGAGGSARIYGAALSRFRRRDFGMGASVQNPDPNRLNDTWPIDYDELRPHYQAVEQRLGICGTPDPLDPDDDTDLAAPPPVAASIQDLAGCLKSNGIHPYRLHVGMKALPGCSECLGVTCLRHCKAHGYNRFLDERTLSPALVQKFRRPVDHIYPVQEHYRIETRDESGNKQFYRARKVVLAAGALQSPLILERSSSLWETPPSMLGRGLMFHSSDIFAVSIKRNIPESGSRKALCFRDLYDVDGYPGGEIQSFGIEPSKGMIFTYLKSEASRLGFSRLGPLLHLLRIPAAIASPWFRHTVIFATITEDFPYSSNRVMGGKTQLEAIVQYTPADELKARCRRLRKALQKAFQPHKVRFLSSLGQPNLGHPMGTCRMGNSPENSVVNRDGQVWGCPDIIVADASVFPSSAGTNPSLTIAANAHRIASRLVEDLKSKSFTT